MCLLVDGLCVIVCVFNSSILLNKHVGMLRQIISQLLVHFRGLIQEHSSVTDIGAEVVAGFKGYLPRGVVVFCTLTDR